MIYHLSGLMEVRIFLLFKAMTSLRRHSVHFRKFLNVFWQAISGTINVQSFIGLPLMVPEILGRESLKTPGPSDDNKA